MPVLTKINTNSIADDAVTGDKFSGSGYLENTVNQDISGTYSDKRLYTSDAYTVIGNVNVTGHLALGSVADSDVVITQDSTERTITGSGTLESGRLMNDPTTSLTGMTGELGNATFPAGHVINRWSKIMTTRTSAEMVACTTTPTTLNLGGTFEVNGITATENNYFLLQTGGWLVAQENPATYAIYFEWDIDGTKVGIPMWMNSTNHMTPLNFDQLYKVPANFTNKTIKFMGSDQSDSQTHKYGTQASGTHPSIPWILIQEIQG
jgi:hypothetical protein